MSALKRMRKQVQDMKLSHAERKFAAETARALVASTAVVNQRRARKQRTPAGGQIPDSRRFSSRALSAPISRPVTFRPAAGLPDIRGLKFRYATGAMWCGGVSGGSNYGQTGNVYFTTSGATPPPQIQAPNGSTVVYVPILPADTNSTSSGVGFGVSYMTDILKHFARVRFNALSVHYEPFAAGSSTTSNCTMAMAPYRGPVTSFVNASNPYLLTSTPTSISANNTNYVASSRDGVTFPSWQSMSLNLTPYIAGGSGAKQNEFPVNTLASVGPGIITPLAVPCAFSIGGSYSGSALDTSYIAQVWVEANIDLLDFVGVLPNSVTPLGLSVDVKAPPDIKESVRPPALSFRDVVRRRVEDAPSPTQSLLGAELHTTHVVPAAARAVSAAMPIPERKPRGP